MHSFFEKLNSLKRQIVFSKERKQDIRDSLVRMIEISRVVSPAQPARRIEQRSSIIHLLFSKPMPITIMIALVALLGGGVSAAAEQSLPGDLLYPVKVGVNEEVRAVLSFSAESKAGWEAEIAGRRLEEATELAVAGNLDEKTASNLKIEFEAHAAKATNRIKELEAKKGVSVAVEEASNFETSLKAHNQILVELKNKEQASADVTVQPINEEVHSAINVLGNVRVELESRSNKTGPEVKAAAEGKIKATENVLASVKSYLQNKKENLSANAFADVELRLSVAEKLIVEAKAELAAEKYGSAFAKASEALRVAEEARLLAKARVDLKLDLKTSNTTKSEDKIETSSTSGPSNQPSNKKPEDDSGSSNSSEGSVKVETRGVLNIGF